MKNFLAVYTGSADSMTQWKSLSESTRKDREASGMKAWSNWARENEKSIVTNGGPLGKTKLVNAKGVTDIRNQLSAYTVVQAESHEAAAKLFINHPHFTIFPGDGVEIMECLPLPKM